MSTKVAIFVATILVAGPGFASTTAAGSGNSGSGNHTESGSAGGGGNGASGHGGYGASFGSRGASGAIAAHAARASDTHAAAVKNLGAEQSTKLSGTDHHHHPLRRDPSDFDVFRRQTIDFGCLRALQSEQAFWMNCNYSPLKNHKT